MSNSDIYNFMIEIVEYLSSGKQPFNNLYYKNYENQLIENLKNHATNFEEKYKEALDIFKKQENSIDKIGILWFSYCDANDVYDELEQIKRKTHTLSI
jgi:hypothetical protein